MTTVQALKRLARNRLDLPALQALYLENRPEIDRTIRLWFDSGNSVQDATSRVLARIAACAVSFNPTVYAAELFIAQLVEEECKRIYYDAWKRRQQILRD